jgi:WD40 repeat protein
MLDSHLKPVSNTRSFPAAGLTAARWLALASTLLLAKQWAFAQGPGGPSSLPPGAVARFGTPFPHHDGAIRFIAFGPTGETLITLARDGVRIWNAATLAQLRQFASGDGSRPRAADLSPDGSMVAVVDGSSPGRIILWEPATGKRAREMASGLATSPRPRVHFSPDGKSVAGVSGIDPTVVIWDVATGQERLRWPAASTHVWDITFSADGKQVITGGDDKSVRLWDAATGKAVGDLGGDLEEVGRVVLSPDGATLATISQHFVGDDNGFWQGDGYVRLWDLPARKMRVRVAIPPGETRLEGTVCLNPLVFSPDSKQLWVGGGDRAVRVLDVKTGREVWQTREASGIPGLLALSGDGRQLALVPRIPQSFLEQLTTINPRTGVASRWGAPTCVLRDVLSSTFRVQAMDAGRGRSSELSHDGAVILSVLSPDGARIATATTSSEILVWDAASGRRLQGLAGHESDVLALGWRDSQTLLSVANDKTLRTWNVSTGKEARKLTLRGNIRFDWRPGPAGVAAFSPDCKHVALVDDEGTVSVTDTDSGEREQTLAFRRARADYVLFVPRSGALGVLTSESLLHFWDVQRGSGLPSCEIRDATNAPFYNIMPQSDVAVSGDRKMVAASRRDGAIAMIDVASQRVIRGIGTDIGNRLVARGPGRTPIAFSPDGRMLATGAGQSSSKIVLFEAATGKPRAVLPGHDGSVICLSFSADGRRLLSGSADGTAMLWDVYARDNPGEPPSLSAAEVATYWSDLANADAVRAFRAIRALASCPEAVVPFLRKALPPVGTVDDDRIGRLIADLGSDDPARRELATSELDAIGEAAMPAVRAALEGQPSRTARKSLSDLQSWNVRGLMEPSPARSQEMRALEVLELAGTPAATKVLVEIAGGAPVATRTVLARAILTRLANADPRSRSAKPSSNPNE